MGNQSVSTLATVNEPGPYKSWYCIYYRIASRLVIYIEECTVYSFRSPAMSMMCAIRLLLVTIAVVVGHANAQLHCTTTAIGHQTAIRQDLPEQVLSPGKADWTLDITSTCNAVGMDVTVCDTDVEPTVRILSLSSVWVHRNGRLLGFARVNVVAYCSNY